MNKILIGSSAIKYHFNDFTREPTDIDYIVEKKPLTRETENGKKVEFYEIPILWQEGGTVLTPDKLYTLKVSHIFWDINWEKHIYDIAFLKRKGCRLNMELFDKLFSFWKEIHGTPKRVNLEVTKDEFFDNNVMGEHEHDYLHTLINPTPTYTKILVKADGVETSDEKFRELSFEDKLALIREECYVMAFERLAGRTFKQAYKWMLKRMVLVHSTIPEALFIIDNYEELRLPIINYKEKIEYELSRNSK